jgi:hypothetical protein
MVMVVVVVVVVMVMMVVEVVVVEDNRDPPSCGPDHQTSCYVPTPESFWPWCNHRAIVPLPLDENI